MSKEYQDASWTGEDTTMNESYLSAAVSPSNNTTQYFSMLEDTTVHDDTSDTIVQLETNLEETAITEADTEDVLLQEPDRVMLYRIQGSDDMYAVQVAEDENGKLQKYQFKVRPTVDGQYEAVQDTITVIPFDASDPIIPHILEDDRAASTSVTMAEEQLETVNIKCEQLPAGCSIDDEQQQLEDQLADAEIADTGYNESGVTDAALHGDDDLGVEDGFQYENGSEEECGEVVDTKQGILHMQSLDAANHSELPANDELKMEEYYRDSANTSSDEDEINLHLRINSSDEQQDHQETCLTDDAIDNIDHLEHKVILNHQHDEQQIQQEHEQEHEQGGTEEEEEELYSQLNHAEDDDTREILPDDGITYVGMHENAYDGSIEDDSSQQHEEGEQDVQILGDTETLTGLENNLSTDEVEADSEDEEGTEYIIATGLQDGEIAGDNGGIEYQQIFVTNDEPSKTPMKSYLDASQLQQLTLAAAASNNNQLPPNAAYIVTKIINGNQSITTTATSIDQGVKLVRSLKIKRIETVPNNGSAAPVPPLVVSNPNSSHTSNYLSSRFMEKENVSNVNVISNLLKPNPRSILKASHIILRKPELEPEEIIDKRFARSKELQRKRMFRDFIAQTTIMQAPIRQERLPRKQLIKPVHRTDEEIIVREMVISSNGNGFIETLDDKVKENSVTSANRSYVQLSDSDSDFKPYNNGKRKRRYKKRKQQNSETTQSNEEVESDDSVMSSSFQDAIDLSADSEGEEIIETIIINSTGKRRGRPPKSKIEASSPSKRRGRPPKIRQSAESIPPEETIRIVPSTEHKCTLCSKVFPSVGSLRSHMNFHKYMEEKPESERDSELKEEATRKTENAIVENKYSCTKCNSTFKNAILLTKHIALHDKKDKFECKVCKKVFIDNIQLNAHRKSHIKDHMFQSTQISPQKRSKTVVSYSCFVCNKSFSSTFLLAAHTKTHKNVFSCNSCGRNFMSKVLLDKHVRIECVKRRSIEGNKRPLSKPKSILPKLTDSSIFLKPNTNALHPRRTLRSKSTTSKDEESGLEDKASISQSSICSSQESIVSVTSTASAPPVLRTPANSKAASSVPGRVTASNIKSSGLPLNVKCSHCDDAFTTFQLCYKHEVLVHGMPTTDTTISVESEKKEKKRIHTPIPGHSGVPANANLAKVFAGLHEKLKHM